MSSEGVSISSQRRVSIEGTDDALPPPPARIRKMSSKDCSGLPESENLKLVRCTPEGELYLALPPTKCDACPFCLDICDLEDCAHCKEKALQFGQYPNDRYTLCQVRRNRSINKCWCVAGSTIYDATAILAQHPGGLKAIMRYSGGSDCTVHMNFHSHRAKKKWKSLKIGEIYYCEGSKDDPHSPPPKDSLCVIS